MHLNDVIVLQYSGAKGVRITRATTEVADLTIDLPTETWIFLGERRPIGRARFIPLDMRMSGVIGVYDLTNAKHAVACLHHAIAAIPDTETQNPQPE